MVTEAFRPRVGLQTGLTKSLSDLIPPISFPSACPVAMPSIEAFHLIAHKTSNSMQKFLDRRFSQRCAIFTSRLHFGLEIWPKVVALSSAGQLLGKKRLGFGLYKRRIAALASFVVARIFSDQRERPLEQKRPILGQHRRRSDTRPCQAAFARRQSLARIAGRRA